MSRYDTMINIYSQLDIISQGILMVVFCLASIGIMIDLLARGKHRELILNGYLGLVLGIYLALLTYAGILNGG